ncbi:ATP-binding protein [Mangrovibacterium lignilyticum]|uniref:ATP-binding protein n=1 Tax=Mangrovibacterium lignilyticum TaxID=2668052 RepID=UPI0013D763A2|nr:ATP-binding protein [Mangrovibacterium lignilyticum]
MIGVWHANIGEGQIFVNDSFAAILGYETSELNPIPKESWFELCDPADHPLLYQLMENVSVGTNNSFSRNCRLKHRAGQWVDVQINGKITAFNELGNPTQVTGTLFDISSLAKSKFDLNYRYQIEKLVAGVSSDFVKLRFDSLDKTINNTLRKIGEFCEIDRSYLFLLHWDKKKLDNTHEWCAPGITPEIDNLKDLPCSVFPWWMEQLWDSKHIYIYDVSQMPEEASTEQEILEAQDIKSLLVVPIQNKGELIGFMGFDSVTAHKDWYQSDIELLETVGNTIGNALAAKHNHDLLILEKEKAEESNRLKSAFLATMNHELRTPLHHILGFSDLIKGKSISDEQTNLYASKIYDSGRNLLQIVEDVLSLATGNESAIKIRKEVVSGIDLYVQHKSYMNEILTTMNRGKEISLELKPDPEFMTSKFLADKNKINQILINLFKNAVKFTHKGTIEYGISVQNNLLTFYMKDEGLGISTQQRDLIFEFFRQGEDTTTRRFHGIGIGLAICKNLVAIQNGDISLTSRRGQGSTFKITIPVDPVSPNLPKQTEHKFFPIPNYSSSRFLLVDEDPNSAFLITNLLHQTNANILTTGNDLEALAYMGESCFLDVILLNIKASSEESLQLVREMRRRCNKCSIIGLSSHSLLSDKTSAIKAGCVDLISKPIDTFLLFEAINKAILSKKQSFVPELPFKKC